MHRVGKWIRYCLFGFTVILGILSVVAWILSYRVPVQGDMDRHLKRTPDTMIFLSFDSCDGVFGVGYAEERGALVQFTGWRFDFARHPITGLYGKRQTPTFGGLFGRRVFHQIWQSGTLDNYVLEVHYAVLVAFFLLLSAILWRSVRRRRVGKGTCANCGYDFTGNVSGVCPECGTELGKITA